MMIILIISAVLAFVWLKILSAAENKPRVLRILKAVEFGLQAALVVLLTIFLLIDMLKAA